MPQFSEEEIAQIMAAPQVPVRRRFTLEEKARALVQFGECEDMDEAYVYLAAMGEDDDYES